MARHVKDLGRFEAGRLMIFGGPQGNLQAIEALRAVAESKELPPEQVICTGDLVGPYGNSAKTLQTIQDWGIACMKGGIEARVVPGQGGVQKPGEENAVAEPLGAPEMEFLGSLPEGFEMTFGGLKAAIVPGELSQVSEFLDGNPQPVVDGKVDDWDILLSGYEGKPAVRRHGKTHYRANVGTIGGPSDSSEPDRAWYLEVTIEPFGIGLETQSFRYSPDAGKPAKPKGGATSGNGASPVSVWIPCERPTVNRLIG